MTRPDALRVLHVVESWPPVASGYAQRSAGLLRAQAARGLAVRVLVSSRQDLYLPADHPSRSHPDGDGAADLAVDFVAPSPSERRLRRLRPFTLDGPHHRRAIESAVRAHRAELVHVHWASALGIAAARAAAATGVPLVAEERFDLAGAAVAQSRLPLHWAEPLLHRWFTRHWRHAAAIVAASQPLADLMLARHPELAGRLEVIPNAIDPDRFSPGPADPALRAAWGVPEGAVVLGTTAKMLRYEGLETLIETLLAFRDRGPSTPPIVAVALGDGPERRALEHLAATTGVPMRFPGTLEPSRIADAYRSFDLFLVPRRRTRVTEHASPLKVLEAMACGLPVLARAVGDVPEMVAEGRGVALPDRDPESWRSAVAALLDSPGERAAMGRRAACWAREQGTWARRAETAESLYRRLSRPTW